MPGAAKVIDPFERAVALVIASRADEKGITQTEMAKAIGITQGQVSRIYNGRRSLGVTEFARACERLGVSPREVTSAAEEQLRRGGEGHVPEQRA